MINDPSVTQGLYLSPDVLKLSNSGVGDSATFVPEFLNPVDGVERPTEFRASPASRTCKLHQECRSLVNCTSKHSARPQKPDVNVQIGGIFMFYVLFFIF